MEGLGRVFNVVPAGDNVYVNMEDVSAVSFVCFLTGGVGDTYTLTEATSAAGGGAQALGTITRYQTSTGNGSDAWVTRTQAAGSTVVAAAAANQNAVVVSVSAAELSDGYTYLKLASAGAGTVAVVAHDLAVQRKADNLAPLGV